MTSLVCVLIASGTPCVRNNRQCLLSGMGRRSGKLLCWCYYTPCRYVFVQLPFTCTLVCDCNDLFEVLGQSVLGVFSCNRLLYIAGCFSRLDACSFEYVSFCLLQYHKHLFVHIGATVMYSDPVLEVNLAFVLPLQS